MGQRDRWLVFLLGALIGAGLLWAIQNQSNPARTKKSQVRESLNLPGMMYDYAVTQKGFYGHYVLYEKIDPQPDGSKVRTIVTGGRRHYTADGTELPQEYLWITETYAAGTALAEPGPVLKYTFEFADRLNLKLNSGHTAAEVVLQSGEVATPVVGQTNSALLKLTQWQKKTQPTDWSKLPDLINVLAKHIAVKSVERTKIDWQAEAYLIKANSSQ